jgi:hypothetical protein
MIGCLNVSCRLYGKTHWYSKSISSVNNDCCQPSICFCIKYCTSKENQCAQKCWELK